MGDPDERAYPDTVERNPNLALRLSRETPREFKHSLDFLLCGDITDQQARLAGWTVRPHNYAERGTYAVEGSLRSEPYSVRL